jgi:hypothetical protein
MCRAYVYQSKCQDNSYVYLRFPSNRHAVPMPCPSYHKVVSRHHHMCIYSPRCHPHLINTLVLQRKRRLSEDLRPVLETTLSILTPVNKVGVVEGKLNRAVDNVVHSLDT